jgi:predicted GNAT family N-acyltransferase
MTEAREEIFVTYLEDGLEIAYVVRGLRDDDEIKAWSKLCASVFSYKSNPPPATYFERHFTNDPNRGTASLIRVAFQNGQMVASCRLFLRTISTAEGTLSAGGIGEVCTLQEHRRRGLSKVLLQNCIEIMKERKLQVSFLHAAPEFFYVYESNGGYKSTKSKWSVVNIKSLPSTIDKIDNTSFSFREAKFPEDTNRLSDLHTKYSMETFVGCIARSSDYWNQYLSQELTNNCFVLEHDGNVIAWLSVRPHGERIQLREFGIDINLITVAQALDLLFVHAAHRMKSLPTGNQQQLVLPTEVLDQAREEKDDFLKFVDWSSKVSEDDHGWMYKIFDSPKVSFENMSGERYPHLIWPSDSF